MSNGVQINLLPALTKDKFNKKNLAISIESHPEDFPQGFAMVCLRRLENQICVNRGTPVPVPSLLRRHSAPTRPVFPVNVPMITTAGLTTKRSASTMSSSPNPPSAIQAASPKIVNSTSLACQSPTTVATPNTLTTSSSFATVRSRTPGTTPAPSSNKRPNTESVSLSDSDPDQVEIGDQIVSLICPISLSRISLPGKGANCKHVQCFDLTTFTNLFRVCKKWKCAVCGEAIGTEELCVSGTFLELLEAYPLGEKCVVKAKGGHAPYVEDKCGPKRKKARRSESAGAGQEGGVAEEPMPMVVVVDLCDDEEDSGKQESPTKHVTLNDSMNSQQASDIIVPIHAPPSTNSSSTTTPPEYMSSRSTMPHHHHHQSIHNTYRYPAASDVAPAAEMDMAVPSPVESQPCSRADRITTSPVPIAVAGQARYSEGFHNDHQDGHDRNDEQTDYSTPPMYWVDRRGSPSSTLSPQKSLSNRLSHPMTPLERDERIQRIFDEVARESSQQRSLSERDEDRRGRVGGMCVGVEDGNEGPGQDQE
ncbi:hypothetical protein DFS34DRAFT_295983 [Phlyctochytrium arcticum]|nr:hypothetical protein DFS34DRAFT_295983 [Phlyctochytrium arcticum]